MKHWALVGMLLGLIAGIVGGFSEGSGSLLILGTLSLFHMVPNEKTAVGTSMFVLLFPISILAVYQYWKRKEINFKISGAIIGTYILGAYLGARWVHMISDKMVTLLVFFLYVIMGTLMFRKYLTMK